VYFADICDISCTRRRIMQDVAGSASDKEEEYF
jgi:hypothetical protein